MAMNEGQQIQEKHATFPCSACGGQMMYDTESQCLKCRYCGNEKAIEHAATAPDEHELLFTDEEELESSLKDWGTDQQAVKCENCGGEMLLPTDQTAGICAFCGSPKVLPQGNPKGIRPEGIIPFRISRDEANTAFTSWKKKRWFVPNAFKKQNTRSTMNGIYIPYWTFDANTASVYSAEVGVYHYRMETRTRTVNGKTETYTERIRYTVWHWTSGDHDQLFNDVLIAASVHQDGQLLEKMDDFALEKLAPYKPEYLSGFLAERYTVSLKEGWDRAEERMKEGLTNEIKRIIGGDEIRHLDISTRYYEQTYKHILLPVWSAFYKYKDKMYRYVVSGETGSVFGRVPRSPMKITLFVLMCLTLMSIAYYVYSQYA